MPCAVLVNPPLLKDNQSSDIFRRKRPYWRIYSRIWLLLIVLLANPVYIHHKTGFLTYEVLTASMNKLD